MESKSAMGNLAEGLGEFHTSCGSGTTLVSVFLAIRKYIQRWRYSNRVWLAHLPSVDLTPDGTNFTRAKAYSASKPQTFKVWRCEDYRIEVPSSGIPVIITMDTLETWPTCADLRCEPDVQYILIFKTYTYIFSWDELGLRKDTKLCKCSLD